MSSQPHSSSISVQEYLSIERASEIKREYFRGEIFAMGGASRRHNRITVNISRRLDEKLESGRCEVFSSDMRVKTDSSGLYTYPDIVVVCDEPQFEDTEVDTLLNPIVLIEVLSKSTEAYDRGKKFEHYRKIPSFLQYVLIAQDRHHVERYTRSPTGEWIFWETNDSDGNLVLDSIDCNINISNIYARIQFQVPGEASDRANESSSNGSD